MVVPPVDHNLLPAADRAELHAETQHVGSHKALPARCRGRENHAQNSACARCSPSPCPLRAWEVAIEPQPDRSVPPSERAAAAAAAKGRLVGRSSPEGFPPKKRKPVIEAAARATGRGAHSSVSLGAPRQRPARHETRRRPGADPAPCAPRACARPPSFFPPKTKKGKPVIERRREPPGAGPQLENGTIVLLLTRPQAGNWVEDGSGAPRMKIPRLVPSNSFRQRLRGALPRSRARGRRAQTRQHTPPAPAEQPRSHAQAPAKDDLQRPHTVTGTHGPGASSLRARRAGQRRIPGRN